MKILGIASSPRKKGNSDILLDRTLEGAAEAGGEVEKIYITNYKISPCVECNSCYRTGWCVIKDDCLPLLEKLLQADRMVFATPIFFMSVCAQAKAFIDRTQCLWSQKYIRKQPIPQTQGRDRRGLVIAVGGSKSKKMFDCIRMLMQYFFDSIDMHYTANLFVNQIDDKGDVLQREDVLQQAKELGKTLVSKSEKPSGKPEDFFFV